MILLPAESSTGWVKKMKILFKLSQFKVFLATNKKEKVKIKRTEFSMRLDFSYIGKNDAFWDSMSGIYNLKFI